jgi:predicted amidohydrolase YtcJ
MSLSRRGFLGVVGAASLASVSEAQAQNEPADLVLYNGKVVTVDDAFSIRQAIAVKDGRVLAVGGNELRNRYRAARLIDLRGRTVLPGFHDTHIHLGGHSRRYIDLNDTTSLAQLKEHRVATRPRSWVRANGSPVRVGTSTTSPKKENLFEATWMPRRRITRWY